MDDRFPRPEDIFQQQADKQKLDKKFADYQSAQEQNIQLNEKHIDLLSKFHEHIALYSAGAITFTTTIIGFVLPNNSTALAFTKFLVPNILYLYVSWVGLGLAFVSALLSKKVYAYYLSYAGFAFYTKQYGAYVEARVEFIKKYRENILFEDKDEKGTMAIDLANIEKLNKGHVSNEQNAKKFLNYVQWCANLALFGAGVGVVALLLFAFFLTQTLVFP